MHILLHLGNAARWLGPLQNHSSIVMENELGLIKKMNKNQNNFAAQEIVEKYLLHVSLRSYLYSLKRVKTIPDQVEHCNQKNLRLRWLHLLFVLSVLYFS